MKIEQHNQINYSLIMPFLRGLQNIDSFKFNDLFYGIIFLATQARHEKPR